MACNLRNKKKRVYAMTAEALAGWRSGPTVGTPAKAILLIGQNLKEGEPS